MGFGNQVVNSNSSIDYINRRTHKGSYIGERERNLPISYKYISTLGKKIKSRSLTFLQHF